MLTLPTSAGLPSSLDSFCPLRGGLKLVESVITCCAYTERASRALLQRTAIRIIDPVKCSVMWAEEKEKKVRFSACSSVI